jgi:hypothetical protein
MSAIVWSDGQDRPVQTIFEGISARQLWQGENGAQAVMVEIAPGAQWEGVDFHQDNSEEVLVIVAFSMMALVIILPEHLSIIRSVLATFPNRRSVAHYLFSILKSIPIASRSIHNSIPPQIPPSAPS